MNGFLVIARFSADDVPVQLFKDGKEAIKFAKTVPEENCRQLGEKLYRCDIGSELICCVVVTFLEGRAVRTIYVDRAMTAELGEGSA